MALSQDATAGQDSGDHKDSAAAADATPGMHLKVYSPYKVYFDDEATSVSAVNETGPFDILPKHHNFITLVSACTIAIGTTKGPENLEINGGLLHVKADEVVLFLNV